MSASGSSGRTEGSWTSGAAGSSAPAIVKTAGSSSYSTRTRRAAASAASFVSAATAATGSPWYLVSPDREDRAIEELRPEARDRLREVGGGHDQPDPGDPFRGGRVDRDDPGARAVERDQCGMEFTLEWMSATYS